MTIYIDNDYRCHASPGEGLRAVETDFFDGKCRAYIDGYRYVPAGETWTREDGERFAGEMIAPWKDLVLLESAQQGYEEAMAALAQLQAENQDMTAALAVLGVTGDE